MDDSSRERGWRERPGGRRQRATHHPVGSLGRGAGSAEDLTAETFVELPSGWGTRVASDLAFAAPGIRRDVKLELNDTAGVIEFIRSGFAVGLVAPAMMEGVDGVKLIPISPDPLRFETQLVWARDRTPKAAARALRERLLGAARG